MQAIKATGNTLTAALDPNDSVGIMDSYFPDTNFFTEFERFDRHIDKLKRLNQKNQVDYVAICSPNYLHDSHMRFALRSGADAICEKPLVLNPWNIDALLDVERDTGKKINTILQLRVHPVILGLRDKAQSENNQTKHEVDLTYITSRGNWYLQSWKGDLKKSGGIATNIGVHFFDMLHFVFGKLQNNIVHYSSDTKAAGFLEYEHARVRWFLSIDIDDIPLLQRQQGQRTFRSIKIDDEEIEFSDGFTDLHTRSYQEILAGRGFGLEENRVAIDTVSHIRSSKPYPSGPGEAHPYLENLI
jgi:UDP-N-acetyl-2-amino-2-deoxyglucuronate dehydrogenase